ncbi:hypothetical protein EDD36DRAFT_78353 [Exophiala viscosa]|uniref:Secreted protein n=1 Tax=Exophiala viscosa TaxID=2486360 RepID=A0AAN6IBI7_9EURO|nr:hypothetical protein EDD36DRAFT_78353 [Exophiala viscosa]
MHVRKRFLVLAVLGLHGELGDCEGGDLVLLSAMHIPEPKPREHSIDYRSHCPSTFCKAKYGRSVVLTAPTPLRATIVRVCMLNVPSTTGSACRWIEVCRKYCDRTGLSQAEDCDRRGYRAVRLSRMSRFVAVGSREQPR